MTLASPFMIQLSSVLHGNQLVEDTRAGFCRLVKLCLRGRGGGNGL
jgi:hypothetical protein